jgi:ferredoxin
MKYQAGTWTCPTTNKRMTDEEYFLAVGALIKCETCGKVVSCTHVCPSKNSNEN